jgi:tyrosyl-tRNA synthetase
MTMPLLEGTDGAEKMSKSLGNTIGIAEPPREIFGKLMRISDELMWRYIDLLSFESIEKIKIKKKAVTEGSNPRDVKFEFAREIVERFHGKAAAERAATEFNARFREGALPAEIPELTLPVLALPQLLRQAGLVPSVSEANRVIEQGGVKIDGEKVSDRALKLAKGRSFVVQVGKRKVARITLT